MICKIYKLTCKTNNKFYIGQTWQTLEERFSGGYNKYITEDIKKYGKDNFYYDILAFCDTQIKADKTEDYYIIKFDAKNKKNAYNMRSGGSTGKLAEETKLELSIISSGIRRSIATEYKPGHIPWSTGKTYKLKKSLKLAVEQEKDIINELEFGTLTSKEIALIYSVHVITIYNIRHGKYGRKIKASEELIKINQIKNKTNYNNIRIQLGFIVRSNLKTIKNKNIKTKVIKQKTTNTSTRFQPGIIPWNTGGINNIEQIKNRKLTIEQENEIKRLISLNTRSYKDIGKEFSVSENTVQNIKSNKGKFRKLLINESIR